MAATAARDPIPCDDPASQQTSLIPASTTSPPVPQCGSVVEDLIQQYAAEGGADDGGGGGGTLPRITLSSGASEGDGQVRWMAPSIAGTPIPALIEQLLVRA